MTQRESKRGQRECPRQVFYPESALHLPPSDGPEARPPVPDPSNPSHANEPGAAELPAAAGDAAPDAGAESARPRRKPRAYTKRPRVVHHYKVDHCLTAADRVEYEALLLDPRQTTKSLTAWLRGRGYDVSPAGVARHRRQFELDVKSIRRDARVACQFAALARAQGGASALADAGQFRFEQLFLEQLFRMKKTDARAAKDWHELGKTLTALLGNRQQLETMKGGGGGAKKRLDGNALADKDRKRLGMPPLGEPAAGPNGKHVGRGGASWRDGGEASAN
jgi:hypothetical protein